MARERTGVVRDSEWVVVFGAVVVVCVAVPSLSLRVLLLLEEEVAVVVSLAPDAAVVSSIWGRGEMTCCRDGKGEGTVNQ